jgi:hypothetical protein
MEKVYIYLFKYLFFVKSIYKIKKNANENGYFLAFCLLSINFHSIFVFIISSTKYSSYLSLWNKYENNKGFIGVIIGLFVYILVTLLLIYFKKSMSPKIKMIFRKSVFTVKKTHIIIYITLSVFFLFWSIKVIAVNIPN